MNFLSDNTAGVAPEILAALTTANSGPAASYGADAITARLREKLSKLFEKDIEVFPVVTGTAANALALATFTPPHGAIFCHEAAHIHVDECGAPEFYSGAKLVPLRGAGGKLTPQAVATALRSFQRGDVHRVQPSTISITQASELGTAYTPVEVEALSKLARAEGLALHMDGARFSNAVAFLGCAPADVTWRAGVDVMSLGFTKNGAVSAEAVIVFEPARVADLAYRRKRSGHLVSKMRFVSAQIEAMIDGGLWLALAARANASARELAEGASALLGVTVEYPVEANEVFLRLPTAQMARALERAGVRFYVWEPVVDRPLIRLVCSFATADEEISAFLAAAKQTA